MCKRAHPIPQVSGYGLVIEGSFRCGHSIVGPAVNQIRNRLNDQLIVTTDQSVKIHSHISCDGPDDLFIRKITADGINAGRIATGGNDAGQALRGIDVAVISHYWRDTPSSVIGQLANFSKMDNARCGRFVSQINHIADHCVAICINHGYTDTVHAGVPIAGGCPIAQITATAIDIFISDSISRNCDAQHQDSGEEKRKNSLHR